MNKIAKFYSDDKLPGGSLLVCLLGVDLTPYVGKPMAIAIEVPGQREGRQYLSPTGPAALEYKWPIEVRLRGNIPCFVIGGDLRSQTNPRTYLAHVYDNTTSEVIARAVAWPMTVNIPKWIEPDSAPLPPQPAQEQPQIATAEPEKPIATPEPEKHNEPTTQGPPPPSRVRGFLALLLLMSGLIGAVWYFDLLSPPPKPLEKPQEALVREPRDLKWSLSGTTGTLNLRNELGLTATSDCEDLRVGPRPAFGSIDVSRTSVTYRRNGEGRFASLASGDAFGYEFTCGTSQWYGTIIIEAAQIVAPAPLELSSIEVRLKPFEPHTVAIDQFELEGGSNSSSMDWRFDHLPHGEGLVSHSENGGRAAKILLTVQDSRQATFTLVSADGRSARGTLVLVPKEVR